MSSENSFYDCKIAIIVHLLDDCHLFSPWRRLSRSSGDWRGKNESALAKTGESETMFQIFSILTHSRPQSSSFRRTTLGWTYSINPKTRGTLTSLSYRFKYACANSSIAAVSLRGYFMQMTVHTYLFAFASVQQKDKTTPLAFI